MTTYLTVIGDRVALAWVLVNSRMAFPPSRRAEVAAVEPGDEFFLVTTRGCFRNPTRDRTRVIARAVVSSAVTVTDEPIELIGRSFDRTCDLNVVSLAPVLSGVALAPLVDKLSAFPNKKAWSIWLRRPLLRITEPDANLLRPLILEVGASPRRVLQGYVELGRDDLRQ